MNWKTTLGGILMALGTIAQTTPIPPQYSWIPSLIAALGGAITGVSAKDFDTHSTMSQVQEATKEATTVK
jgi:hypothetical protein